MTRTNGSLSAAAIALLNSMAEALAPAVNAGGVSQPELAYATPATRKSSKARVGVPEFTLNVHGAGVAVDAEFEGVLTVSAPRAKKQPATGKTRDCVLTIGKATTEFTMNDGSLGRLQQGNGTRVFVGGRCFLITLA